MQNRLFGFVLFALSLHAEVKVLKNFTLIDGTGKAPLSGAAMIVDSGKIQWVGPAAQLKAPAGAETIDLSGKYVMPGIINLHGHLGAVMDLKQDGAFETPENVEKNLKTYASYGVTAVVSMGTDKDFVIGMRDKQRAGRPGEARIFSAGQGFIFKGGYGGLAGVTPGVETAAEVEPIVAKLAAEKVDIIKFWMDDHLGTMKKMPHEIGKAIIDSAHNHNIPVAAHIFYLEDAKALADYGVNALAHSVRDKPVDQALIDSMKKHGTWQIGTFTREASIFTLTDTPAYVNDPFFMRGVSANVIATLKTPEFHQIQKKADPHYEKFHEFLDTAEKNLIQAATKNSAEFLKTKDLGTLEKSKWADLIVLDKNPLENIRNTRTIAAVYIAGNRVN